MGKGGMKVGVFDNSHTNAPIPEEYLGQRIWYSADHGFFLITDENNKTITDFDMAQFRKFFDANVILYTNNSIRAYIEKEMKTKEAEQSNQFSQGGYSMPAMPDMQSGYQDPYAQDDYYDNGYGNDLAYQDDYQDDYQPSGGQESEYSYVNAENAGRRMGNRRDARNTGENDPNTTKKIKDPTKHITAFFVTTLIIAIVAFIVINYAEPIMNGVAPLLS